MTPGRVYRIVFSRPASKSFEGLTTELQRRIGTEIDGLRIDLRPHGCEKLKGREDQYRIRVGDYRVVYTIEDERLVVLVLQIGNRRNVYGRRRK